MGQRWGHFHCLTLIAAAAAKSPQSCPTLCDPKNGSPPGSPVPGILQARTLEWVAISFSNAWKWKVRVKSLSRVRLLTTPWTAAHQAPPSMGFSRQECWSGVPLPTLITQPIFSATVNYRALIIYYIERHTLMNTNSFQDFLANPKMNWTNLYRSKKSHSAEQRCQLIHLRAVKTQPAKIFRGRKSGSSF